MAGSKAADEQPLAVNGENSRAKVQNVRGDSSEEVQQSAKFLIDTVVYPELKELEKIVHDPGKPWYRRAVDLAKSAPKIVTSFSALPKSMALAMLFAKISGALADVRDEQLDKEHKLGRTGLHFLLKLKQQG